LEDLCDDRDVVDCAGVYGGSKQTRRGAVARTEPRTEPTITPVWLEWEDDLPMTGTDDVVEGGGEDDEAEVGIVGEVVGGEVGVGVEGRVGDVAEGSADVEEGIAGVEGSADVEEGVAGVEDVGVVSEAVAEGDGTGEGSPTYTQAPSLPRGI
jgi:hypothetical protein